MKAILLTNCVLIVSLVTPSIFADDLFQNFYLPKPSPSDQENVVDGGGNGVDWSTKLSPALVIQPPHLNSEDDTATAASNSNWSLLHTLSNILAAPSALAPVKVGGYAYPSQPPPQNQPHYQPTTWRPQISTTNSPVLSPLYPPPAPTTPSPLVGNCTCPASPPSCGTFVVYRPKDRVVPTEGGKTTVVTLEREKLKPMPIMETLYLKKEYADVKYRTEWVEKPVTLEREVLNITYEPYDVVINRIEVKYNDIEEVVYLWEDEPEVSESAVSADDSPSTAAVPVELEEEIVNMTEDEVEVTLNEEFPEQTNLTMTAECRDQIVRPVPYKYRVIVVKCKKHRIFTLPPKNCGVTHSPSLPPPPSRPTNSYLPPSSVSRNSDQ